MRSVKKRVVCFLLTILIDFFQIAVYLTLFVSNRYLVSGLIASNYESPVLIDPC